MLIVAVVLPWIKLAWPDDAMPKVWMLLRWTTNTSYVSGVESLRTLRMMLVWVSPCNTARKSPNYTKYALQIRILTREFAKR